MLKLMIGELRLFILLWIIYKGEKMNSDYITPPTIGYEETFKAGTLTACKMATKSHQIINGLLDTLRDSVDKNELALSFCEQHGLSVFLKVIHEHQQVMVGAIDNVLSQVK